jgi:uncharacterized protein (DUF488 family)
MEIYTIGFTQTTAENFFSRIKEAAIELLIDVRLKNISQLAGFAKAGDLGYFLKTICNCGYIHDIKLAPSKELLKHYKNKKIDWEEYTQIFNKKLDDENVAGYFLSQYSNYSKVCLLCSEGTPEKCHRRLVAEKIQNDSKADIKILHL